MKPANHTLNYRPLASKGNLTIFVIRHLLRLSIALCKLRILGLHNLPLTRFITLITLSALVRLSKYSSFFANR